MRVVREEDKTAAITRLIAERDILATLHTYAQAMDRGDEQAWVDVFTHDAVFDVVNAVTHVRVHREEGRAQLARYIASYPKPPHYRKHIVIDPVITVNDATAQVKAYWLLLVRAESSGVPEVIAFGSYQDRLERREGGWRIVERLAEVEATTVRQPT
jgi:3-phenylpropionate/cinnamic acid dioxygenase small subunit